jgi:hypothetical protein
VRFYTSLHPNGILGKIANNNAMGLAGLAPLAPTAAASPLYNMFSAGLGAPDTIPNNVAVGGRCGRSCRRPSRPTRRPR